MVFLKHPEHDAVIAVHQKGEFVCLDFLAQGNSQVRKKGKITGYTKRNPERRAMFDRIMLKLREFVFIQRHGKGLATVDPVGPNQRITHKGTWRMQLFLYQASQKGAASFLQVLKDDGFEPVKHRPVEMNWPKL